MSEKNICSKTTHKKIPASTAGKILDLCNNNMGNKNTKTDYSKIVYSHTDERKHYFSGYEDLIKNGNLTPEERKDCFKRMEQITEDAQQNSQKDREEASDESTKEVVGWVISGIVGFILLAAFSS